MNLVIGLGEVGLALGEVMNCQVIDKHDVIEHDPDEVQILHIAFPWQIGNFQDEVLRYVRMYEPYQVVVHSTVPPNTCDQHGWTHSPVRGRHPKLADGLRAFTKHYGGNGAQEVATLLAPWFPSWETHEWAATTEAGKLFELVQYGVQVVVQKTIYDYCHRMELPFDEVYTSFAETYNEGWLELQYPEFMRPVLAHMPGPIGGHCVFEGAKMLQAHCNDLMAQVVIAVQKELKGE